MDLIRWDPFRNWSSLRGEMDRYFNINSGLSTSQGWTPSVDVFEDENSITVKAELPEVDKKDIHVDVNDDMLTIRGERKLEKEEKKENYRRVERSYGSFSRSFSLPENVDREKISAECKDGVLRVTLPKTKAAKAKPVSVAVK